MTHVQSRLDGLLPTVPKPLDWETYLLAEKPIVDDEFLAAALIVDQASNQNVFYPGISQTGLRAIAAVDRTADVDEAAKQIVDAHFAFSGQSPHSPDLIIVDEWVKDQFLNACNRRRKTIAQNSEKYDIDVDVG